MKKISQIDWKLYKESATGKADIASFQKLLDDPNCSYEDMLNLGKKYDPQYFSNFSPKEEKQIIEIIKFYDDAIGEEVENYHSFEKASDYEDFYLSFVAKLLSEKEVSDIDEIPQAEFKKFLSDNLPMSIILYAYLPGVFIPNFFVMQFSYLKRIADKYDIELPQTPNRSDYKSRNLYYLDMCGKLIDFAVENGFENTAEFCAFLFGYELPKAKEEMMYEANNNMPDTPNQAWIIIGNYGEGEKEMDFGFWQANEFTSRGDVLLFYEKSPVKAMNSVWIAQADGVVDPFFYYYSSTYIGNKIAIPADKSVKYEDFKNSEYFKKRDKKGNFVSKNFQDVSGWAVKFDDYAEIKRILETKGFNTSILPSLYEPTKVGNVTIEHEKDVSEKLLIPLLEQMGWKNKYDFEGEVEFNAGRGQTGYSSDKRPDFVLHITRKNDDIEVKVAIEVKKLMKNEHEVHDNFVQGRSYAKWGNAKVLVLCDMRQILVYLRDKNNKFNENNPIQFSWIDMEDPDKFKELKKLLS